MFETPDVDTQSVKRFDRAMWYVYDIKFGMLQVRKNEISLRKCSGSFAHLRNFEETLVTREWRNLITTVNLNRKLGYFFFFS